MKKRAVSFLLAVAMLIGVFSALPLSASAAWTVDYSPYPKVESSYSVGVISGTVRYISQISGSTYFYSAYWPSSSFGGYSSPGTECGTASISMALSYIGVNKTPKQILEANNGYTYFTGWGPTTSSPTVSTGMNNYINGNGKYSPVIIHLPNYSAAGHWVVLIGQVSSNVYYVLDPANAVCWNITINGTSATYTKNGYTINDTVDRTYQYYNSSAAAVTCTVTFDANGGSCSTTSKTVSRGASLSSLPTASRSGYRFNGWYTAKSGGTKITTSTTFSSNSTVYAQWSCNHSYSSYVVAVATCTQTGLCRYTCSTCGLSYTETIPTAGHSFSSGTCTVCGTLQILGSGSCGTNTTWVLDGNGLLTISGSGPMEEYGDSSDVSWHSYRSSIKTIKIGYGVTSVGANVFWDCDSLTSVTIPSSVTKIGEGAFWDCDSLTSVSIPYGVTSIGDYAFEWCQMLKTVTIPTSVTSVGSYAFYGCGLTSIEIPNSLSSINDGAFGYCNLESVEIPNSVTSIGGNAFRWCDGLTSITIPDGVTSIGNCAFEGCNNLTSVTLPYSVESIGYSAFRYCESLTGATVLNATCVIDNAWPTLGVPGTTTIYGHSGSTAQSYAEKNGFAFALYSEDGTPSMAYIGMCGEDIEWSLDISSGILTISGNGEMYDFPDAAPWQLYKNSIISVIIEDDVTSLGSNSFENCTNLMFVDMTETVNTIGDSAFWNCPSLEYIDLHQGITSVGESAFALCTGLRDVFLPASVESIGQNAFYGTTSLDMIKVVNKNCDIYDATDTLGVAGTTTIYSYNDATARSYAEKYGYAFDELTLCMVYGCDYVEVDRQDADCQNAGYVSYECLVCGEVQTYPLEALAHRNAIRVAAKAASCTKAGNIEYWYCGNCGSYFSDEAYSNEISLADVIVAATGHNYDYVINAPIQGDLDDPEGEGTHSYVCSTCGDISVSCEKHSWDDGVVVHEPTCETPGIAMYTCVLCNAKKDGFVEKGHNIVTDEAIAPTCTEPGLTEGQRCSDCNELIRGYEVIPALGHSYVGETTEPTCVEQGYTTYTCSVCGDSHVSDFTEPGNQHKPVYYVAKDPTCTERGYIEHYCCSGCGKYFLDVECIYQLPESYVIKSKTSHVLTYVAAKAATCTENGNREHYACSSSCGKYFADADSNYTLPESFIIITATDHSYSYTNNVDDHTVTCENGCGYATTEAHSFVEGTCACGAVEITGPIVDENIYFGEQLALENDLTMTFRLNPALISAYDINTLYIEVERDVYGSDGSVMVEKMILDEYVDDGRRWVFSLTGISAAQMNDEIRATLHIKDAQGKEYVSPTLYTSVTVYLRDTLTNMPVGYDELYTLIMDMLSYGTAAQYYFSRHTDAPAIDAYDIFKDYASYASADLSAPLEDMYGSTANEGATGKLGQTLDLGTRIGITYKVTLPEGIAAEDAVLIVKDAEGNELEKLQVAGNPTDNRGRYIVNFYGSTSRDMRRVVYATVYVDGVAVTDTYTYSISTYAYETAINEYASAEMLNVTKAMVIYGDAANAYFGG